METEKAINTRKTIKVLSDTEWAITQSDSDTNQLLSELMALAATAPFHYFCEVKHRRTAVLNSLLPWRCYSLTATGCRELARVLTVNRIEAGKILQMLHTANALILVTWLPDVPEKPLMDGAIFDPTLKNMEHLAAASSAVQNILLGATSKEIPNYWSSGGVLRDAKFFDYLGISDAEILLSAIFLFPNETKDAEIKYGANRKDAGTVDQFWKKLTIE